MEIMHVCLQQNSLQIYVGRAEPGVVARWLTGKAAHCMGVWKVLEGKELCRSTFDQMVTRCQYVQLADCYLALALMRGYNAALFVVENHKKRQDLYNAEGDLQQLHAATNMVHGLNCREEKSTKPKRI